MANMSHAFFCSLPIIVCLAPIYSPTATQPTASSAASLRVYYCICGEFILVIDKSLTALPKRKTDGAIVVRSQDSDDAKARVFKLNANRSDPVLIERQGGHERQYRFLCPRCTLPVAYQSTLPPAKSGPFIYLLPGTLPSCKVKSPLTLSTWMLRRFLPSIVLRAGSCGARRSYDPSIWLLMVTLKAGCDIFDLPRVFGHPFMKTR
ncbi:hypothetical protein F5146DRAFT_252349 [Armillaria mellea]|nr:hypothetical protein F5146DRAFT_542195 [Armillaria mellea]KAK0184225.1 hypothetical protein F5146DRAFT_252349 [Armillaria mellea]